MMASVPEKISSNDHDSLVWLKKRLLRRKPVEFPFEGSLKHPIALVHGMGGRKGNLDYFVDVAEDLEGLGCTVLSPNVSRYGDVYDRAESLAEQLDILLEKNQLQGQRLNLIAHGVGGLDARRYICALEGHRVVASLTTIATPHRGSLHADEHAKRGGPAELSAELRDICPFDMEVATHENMTTEWARTFNKEHPDHPDVSYFSYGAHKLSFKKTHFMLKPSYAKHAMQSGEVAQNDGVSSVASSRWGTYVETFNMDHMDLINWGPVLDGRVVYRKVAAMLEQQGL